MALIKCLECGNEISEKTKVCVHCGYKIKKPLKKVPKIMAIIGFALLILDVIAFILFEFGPKCITKFWYYYGYIHIVLFSVLYVSIILILIYCISNKKIQLLSLTIVALVPIMTGFAVGGKIKCENELYEKFESHANTDDRFLIYTYLFPKSSVSYGECMEFLGNRKVAVTSFSYNNKSRLLISYSHTHYYTYSFETNLFGMYGQLICDGTIVYLINENGNSFEESNDSCFRCGTWSNEGIFERY